MHGSSVGQRHGARLKLVVDNDSGRLATAGRRAARRKVPLEFLESIGRKSPAFAHTLEKLTVIDDDRSQARFGDSVRFAESRRIVQQLVVKGHLAPQMLDRFLYAGFTPHLSTGNFPHTVQYGLRDNARMGKPGIRARIRSRLQTLGISANAASAKAGLHRDYISEMLAGDSSPRLNTIEKLAIALQCDPSWLATGDGLLPEDDVGLKALQRRLLRASASLSPERREALATIVEAMEASEAAPSDETG